MAISYAYPMLKVSSTDLAYRRHTALQHAVDAAAGVNQIARDAIHRSGVPTATIVSLSAAPDAALFLGTVTGNYNYLTEATKWSLPPWEFTHFLAHDWTFSGNYQAAMISPLDLLFRDPMTLRVTQLSLQAFPEAEKVEFIAAFREYSDDLLGHHVPNLLPTLNNYLHIIFAVTLMRADLQIAFVAIADRLAALVAAQSCGPSPLTAHLLLAVFDYFQQQMREFLNRVGATRTEGTIATNLERFRCMVLDDQNKAPLKQLFKSYNDLSDRMQHRGCYHTIRFRIVHAVIPHHLILLLPFLL
jgi:hypothetical protein